MLAPAGRWLDLGSGARVRQSRAYWMNSLLLLDRAHAVLVDPGVLPSELDEIAAAVREAAPARVTLLLSHAHWDHVLGWTWWPEALAVAHERFAAALAGGIGHAAAEAEAIVSRAGERARAPLVPFAPHVAVRPPATLGLGPWTLALHDAPGHCDHQLAVHLPERRLLFCADMLSDLEIPMLEQPAAVYRDTLERVRALVARGEVETLVPGHGAPVRGVAGIRERLDRDLAYLAALAAAVREARAAGGAIADAEARLAELDYVGREAEYSMVEVHRENLRVEWAAAGPPAR